MHYAGMADPQLTGLLHEVSRQPKVDPCPILTMNPAREPAPGTIVHERYCAVHVQDLRHQIAVRGLMPGFQASIPGYGRSQNRTLLQDTMCDFSCAHNFATLLLRWFSQGDGGVWYAGSWCNWLGHSGAVDAGLACARRLGAHYPLKGDIARKEFHADCCFDMFGPRFDWETSVRKARPILRAAL